jgi:Holliday junction resolvase RusA-like endonuclease
MTRIAFTILGEPASKANSRELATIGPKDKRRTILRKSEKALAYERDALRQIPPKARVRLEGPVRVTLRIWYASERPDLDESIVLDVLQDRWCNPKRGEGVPVREERILGQAGVYRNDRQVREKHVFHAIDRANPRAEIVVEPLHAQQGSLLDGAMVAPPSKTRPTTEEEPI